VADIQRLPEGVRVVLPTASTLIQVPSPQFQTAALANLNANGNSAQVPFYNQLFALYNGALYAETNDRIVRYALPPGTIAPTAQPEVIVSGLPLTGDHPMHPFAIDPQGALYVDLGSATNSCQVDNRMPNSAGINPCTELETRAGTWRYDDGRVTFNPFERLDRATLRALGEEGERMAALYA